MMPPTREELRRVTLADNFGWLRGFGCRIEKSHGLYRVHHPELPEYDTWLLLEPAVAALHYLLEQRVERESRPAQVYVDQEAQSAEIRNVLTARFVATASNVTFAARLPEAKPAADLSVTEALPAESRDWADIYWRGFARPPELLAVERRRWARAFAAPAIRHWFIGQAGRRIGVFQTTRSRVVGIYSFTLVPEVRGAGMALRAVRAILADIHQTDARWVYFEKLTLHEAAIQATRALSPFVLVRTLTGYSQLPE